MGEPRYAREAAQCDSRIDRGLHRSMLKEAVLGGGWKEEIRRRLRVQLPTIKSLLANALLHRESKLSFAYPLINLIHFHP